MRERGVERPGRCYPAAVLVEPAIACFGRVRALVRVGDQRVILEMPLPEFQSGQTRVSKSVHRKNVDPGIQPC